MVKKLYKYKNYVQIIKEIKLLFIWNTNLLFRVKFDK